MTTKIKRRYYFYYVAANQFEGCGHKHRTARAAKRCLPRIDRAHGPVWIHRGIL